MLHNVTLHSHSAAHEDATHTARCFPCTFSLGEFLRLYSIQLRVTVLLRNMTELGSGQGHHVIQWASCMVCWDTEDLNDGTRCSLWCRLEHLTICFCYSLCYNLKTISIISVCFADFTWTKGLNKSSILTAFIKPHHQIHRYMIQFSCHFWLTESTECCLY